MEAGNGCAPAFEKSQDHDDQKQEQGSLGGDQMKPVERGRNRMKLDPAPDPFDLHDDRAGNIAPESDKSGQDMTSPDPDEVRRLVGSDHRPDPFSDPGSMLAHPDVPCCQIPGQCHVNQERHEENIGVHRVSVAFSGGNG